METIHKTIGLKWKTILKLVAMYQLDSQSVVFPKLIWCWLTWFLCTQGTLSETWFNFNRSMVK